MTASTLCCACKRRPRRKTSSYCYWCNRARKRAHDRKNRIKGHEGESWLAKRTPRPPTPESA